MVMGLAALLAAVVAWILLASTPWRLRMKSQSSDAYLDVLLSVLRQPPFPLADGDSRSIERDIQTIMVRVANEGISFLTKTLPAFGKRVLLSVEEGMLVDFPGFATMKSQPHPAFLQVVTTRLFDSEGRLRTDADPLAMKHLEQVVFMFYKLGLPHTEHESQNVINGFVQVDDQLAGLTLPDDEIFVVAKSLVRSVVQGYNPDIFRPRHGPGAVATGERLDDKWFFGTIYGQLEKSFPYIRCFTAMDPAGGKADFDILSRVKPALNGCAKVVLVPKDSRDRKSVV